ncbi:uncharacterized protein LOC108904917 [Anoplophora glabripennis]|uniref:uncharacterized protein LOC108904917 n=1 Tax=Anoplophora glabripennis TaxID=217634 RepID=UPI00087503DD|nr:uncharacterized protein LOC108904917 [Anoplophora glabripennis]
MEYIYVLILAVINPVICYYFYNPATHQLFVSSSLDNIPGGYKLIPPPRSHTRRRSRLAIGYCGDGGFTCSTPYAKALTFQFECSSDDNCPSSYKCCSQKCFLHKVCIKAESSNSSNISDRNKKNYNYERPGQCDKWTYDCQVPYHYSMTYRFKCNQDSQCPGNFKCCQQNCFVHKICSKIVANGKKTPEKIVPAEKTETQQTNEITTEINPEELTEVRSYFTTTTEKEDEETIESTTSTTTTEATTVTEEEAEEEVYTYEDSDNAETTTEYDVETLTIENNLTTEQVTEIVVEETTGAELNTTVAKISLRKVTIDPIRTTLDTNAIDPNYVEKFYDYDNDTTTENDAYEYEEYDDYEDETGDN